MSGLFGAKKSASQSTKAVSALQVQTSTSGQCLPLLWGANLLAGNLLWYGNFISTPHTSSSASGGKGGGGGSSSTTSYTYTTGVMISLCEGPIAGLGTIWNEQAQNTAAGLGLSVFTGATPQTTWAWLTSFAPSQALPYNGTAYVAASALNLGSDTSLPNFNFEVLGPLAYSAGTINDAVPSDILNDYLTSATHGAGFAGYVGSLTNLRNYCLARSLFLSPIEDQQRTASSFLDDMSTWCNFACVWSYKQLNFIPYGDTPISSSYGSYTPNVIPIYSLGADDFLYTGNGTNGVELDWKDVEDCYNSVAIEYNDRSQGYNTSVQNATDQADVDARGPYPMSDVQVNGITTAAVARDVAQLMLQRSLYIRKTYSFSTSLKYMLLEPMDPITLTDPNAGLFNELVRITKVSEQDDQIDFEAEELPIGVAHAPIYNTQSPNGYSQNYNVSPGDVSPPVIFNAPGLLTKTGYETWIAVAGIGAFWGGCQVYFSADNLTYKQIGTISAPARYGALTAALPAGSDPDTTDLLKVAMLTGQLTSGTQADADNWRQFCFVGSAANGGEFIAFETATLTGTEAYTLSYLRRGGYGSSSQPHIVGDVFARIDDGIFRVPYDRGMVGQTVYFKFASFNEFGGGQEALSSATAYSHVLGASDVLAPPLLFDQLAGQYATPSSGSNFVPNPSFELNNIGAVGPVKLVNQPVCDSWYVSQALTGFSFAQSTTTPDVGSNNMLLQIAAGTSIPASGSLSAAASSAPIYVQAGQLVSISGDILTYSTGGNGSNLTFNTYVGLNFFTAGGALISNALAGISGATTGTSSYSNYANNQLTVPAGASYACAFVYLSCGNSGSTAQTVASFAVRFDNLFGQFVTAAGQVNYATGQSVASLQPASPNADNTALAASPAVINGNFSAIPTGTGWTPDAGTGWVTDTTTAGPTGSNSGKHVGGSGSAGGAYRNAGLAACQQGQVYKTQALIKAVSANGTCYVYISWCNASGTEIATTLPASMNAYGQSNYVTGTTSGQGSYAFGTAPAGAVFARTCLAVSGNTSGTYYVDNVVCTSQPSTTDEVPDGQVYKRTVINSGSAVVLDNPNFESPLDAQGNVPGWKAFGSATLALNTGAYYDGSQALQITTSASGNQGAQSQQYSCSAGDVIYARCYCDSVTGGGGIFAISFVNAAGTVLAIPNAAGTAYNTWQALTVTGTAPTGTVGFQILLLQATSGGVTVFDSVLCYRQINLAHAVSGTLPNQTYIPNITFGSVRSLWSSATTITAAYSTATPAVVTLNVSAGSLQFGSVTTNYSASSASTTQARGTTISYFLYYLDAANAGGALTLNVTTNANLLATSDAVIWIGSVSCVVPASGSGSGGSGGGNGGGCVMVASYMPGLDFTAGDVIEDDEICGTSEAFEPGTFTVSHVDITLQPCLRLTTASGATIVASDSTPMTLRDGGAAMFPDMLGREVYVMRGDELAWETVVALDPVGLKPVNRISIAGNCYWAGEKPDAYILTHNTGPLPK